MTRRPGNDFSPQGHSVSQRSVGVVCYIVALWKMEVVAESCPQNNLPLVVVCEAAEFSKCNFHRKIPLFPVDCH